MRLKEKDVLSVSAGEACHDAQTDVGARKEPGSMTCPCCCVAAVPGLNMHPTPTSALQEGYSPWSVTRIVVMPGPPSLVGGWG